MTRRRWFFTLLLLALAYRKGRTALLLGVLAMAASLATALGVVSFSMDKRVAEEVRKYGANLVIIPETARLDIGSGGLNFGVVSEPAYMQQKPIQEALQKTGLHGDSSFHLRGALRFKSADVLVEGVDFGVIRRLLSWWQVQGNWPQAGEAVIGTDLALRLGLKTGDSVELVGPAGKVNVRLSGVVSSGGEEDGLLFLPLPELQRVLGLQDKVTQVRLLVTAQGVSLSRKVAELQPMVGKAKVSEVRQIARTSEALLAKVKLLMLLVTSIVLVSSASSVTGTMSATVLERSKEIGLMKAMGGTQREVLLVFCGEAALLGIFGGVVGYLLGTAIAQFITISVFSASADFIPWFFFLSLAVSTAIALLGSIGPMISVFRLDPVQSLRGE